MDAALALAVSVAEEDVLPNPRVGAVIVRKGAIIGRGAHRKYGGPHAEAAALEDCQRSGETPRGATMYVTLEPCSFRSPEKHNGPCTDKILASGISRVVIARLDINPKVRGRGMEILRDGGIDVVSGVNELKAAALNRCYEVLQEKGRPYVTLKAALTMDGFLAASGGSSHWISCPESRKKVMELRASSEGVLVGSGTWKADNPRLTVRDEQGNDRPGKQPRSIVLSRSGPELEMLLKQLYDQGVWRLLVEGGGGVFTSFFKAGLWDALYVFQSPDVLGQGIPFCGDLGIDSMQDKLILKDISARPSGRDREICGYREELLCLQV